MRKHLNKRTANRLHKTEINKDFANTAYTYQDAVLPLAKSNIPFCPSTTGGPPIPQLTISNIGISGSLNRQNALWLTECALVQPLAHA
ncbi:hypothetical protein ACTXT7_016996 [Hymenolepis weldensis]